MDEDKLLEVGEYNQTFNELMGLAIPIHKIYRSKGLPSHLVKRQHFDCLKHIDDIPDIISSPDYIGINPNEPGDSIELIKTYDKNILIGIKLDSDGDYLYISSMYVIQESKIERRINGGRIKKINEDA